MYKCKCYNCFITKEFEQKETIRLRREGETIPTIAKKLNVSKASVSLWTKGVNIPLAAQLLMRERALRNRGLVYEKRRQRTKNILARTASEAESLSQATALDTNTMLIVCSLMYWCEGTKFRNDSEFTFTNADPLTISGFMGLLRKSFPLQESKFRIKMHLHQYHNETAQRSFWSKITGVPESQFTKTFWKPHTGKNKRKNYPGCIHVRYHDVIVARQVCATARAFLKHVA